MEELNLKEQKEVEGGSITAATVGVALLGVSVGVVIGAALAIGVCYVVKRCCQ